MSFVLPAPIPSCLPFPPSSPPQELDYLVGAISSPVRPLDAIVGGSKVSSKIGVLEALLEKCDVLILGGGMIFTFYKAKGLAVGSSLVEEDKVQLAGEVAPSWTENNKDS